ncbi:MAG: fatty acid desaturase [Cyanosarcina radialis HA8281-LM2]|jgi:beta-carotene ketolase (CrtW type)|nr:fatty acid desaturase [Cyanosarcina radialis HA8281-LM2]
MSYCKNSRSLHYPNSVIGIGIALAIAALWIVSLTWLLFADISQFSILGLIVAVFIRTFLHTGLFITAHDAMHGNICPQNHQVNNLIGAIALVAYAFLPYKTLLIKHRLHHRYPASVKDPDFCESYQNNLWLWYLKFMQEYLDLQQLSIFLIGIIVISTMLRYGCNLSIDNLILFWILPIFLSSVQLFYFGTFLSHRQPIGGYSDRHRCQSSNYSVFWSFLACYHFSYHWEHHEYPHLPWYKLPMAKDRGKFMRKL